MTKVYTDKYNLFAKILSLMQILDQPRAYLILEGREYADRELQDPEWSPKPVPVSISGEYLTVERVIGLEAKPEGNLNLQFVAREWMPPEYLQTNSVGKLQIIKDLFGQYLTNLI